jgi:alkanesulfonate monooxygenase SsuD/methylene tetrahydromethanopterin reductase-like flavin-dependent oxidoreductase (luciferase family)
MTRLHADVRGDHDHVTHGRAGRNIVRGWNQAEFHPHGVTSNQDTRFDTTPRLSAEAGRTSQADVEFAMTGEGVSALSG